MELPKDRLKWARERAGFETPTDAARSRGWIVSTYLGHENGDRIPSRAKAKKYAKAFKVRWEWILEGEGTPTDKAVQTIVRGYVGARGRILPIGESDKPKTDDIKLPPGAPPDAEVVIVRSDSLYPRYFEGEHLFYTARPQTPAELIGRECVVKLKSGEVLVRVIRRGSRRNLFNLESWNAPVIEDQAIEWAAPVLGRG